MGSLQHHHRSLIDHLNESFRELTEESDKHHAQLQELAKENKILKMQRAADESRIQGLLSEIARLQNTKESANEEEGQDALEQKLQLLERTYEPQKVADEARRDVPDLKDKKASHGTDIRYEVLYNETVTLIRVSQSLRNQVKRYKERAAQWQRWANLSHRSGADDGNKVTRDENTRRIHLDEQLPRPSHSHPTAKPDAARPDSSRELDDELPRTPLASTPPSARFGDVLQSTATNDSNFGSTAPHPSSTASNSSVHEEEGEERVEGGNQSTIRIKDEPFSPGSLPGSSPTGQGMQPSGSQDLDEVGDAVVTPRSRKFAVFEDEMSRTQQYERVNRSIQKGERRVFQPKDANQTNHFMKPRESSFKRRRTGDSGASAISSVSEDGDEDFKRKNARNDIETPCKGSTRDPEAHRRLDDLLEVRPQKHNFTLGRTPGHSATSASRRSYTPRMLSAAAQQTTTTPSGGMNRTIEEWVKPKSALKTNRRTSYESNTGREDWNAIMQSVPYRELPVDCLDVSCFKPNPARNDGLDYAFHEVVRNHEQRKCLPGCMRADCCGDKFRAMVRTGGVKYDEETHRALLEDFLGDQKHTLGQLSEDERNNLLVEAKARQLANQFSKHRYVYERARSPPGFWRTEMPSTQELAKDRIEADRIEREKVLDRFREAMRPNGLWRFADEV